jgi:hypothetical protein
MQPPADATPEHEYTVTVRKAVFVPDLDAVREFAAELKAELNAHPDVAKEFSDDPNAFLGARGMNIDLQNEFLVEQGVPGAEEGCGLLSCIVSDGCIITAPVIVIVSA